MVRGADGPPLDARFLAGETPFAVLGLSIDADTPTIRRRLDELQLLERMQAGGDERAARYREAANGLQDPARRLAAELLSPWTGAAAYAGLHAAHDAALSGMWALLRTPVERTAGASYAQAAVSTIEAWSAVVLDPGVVAAVRARASGLGARVDDRWLGATVGAALAALLQRLPAALAGESPAALLPTAAAVSGLPEEAAAAPARVLLGAVRDALAAAAPGGLAGQAPVAFALTEALAPAAVEECAALRSDLARRMLTAARDAYAGDDTGGAERLLATLAAQPLDDADRADVERERMALREAIARREEAEFAAAPAWRPRRRQPTAAAVPGGSGGAPWWTGTRALIGAAAIAVLAAVGIGAVAANPGWIGLGGAAVSTGDPERDAIERARASLERQSDELLALEAAVDALRQRVQSGRPPTAAGSAAVTQFERDLARYNDLLPKLRAATEAYNVAETAFNRQVAAYNEKFRR